MTPAELPRRFPTRGQYLVVASCERGCSFVGYAATPRTVGTVLTTAGVGLRCQYDYSPFLVRECRPFR